MADKHPFSRLRTPDARNIRMRALGMPPPPLPPRPLTQGPRIIAIAVPADEWGRHPSGDPRAPVCADCRFFDSDKGRCGALRDPVTGDTLRMLARTRRGDKRDACGPDGREFEPRYDLQLLPEQVIGAALLIFAAMFGPLH